MSPPFWIFRGLSEDLASVLPISECGWTQHTPDAVGPLWTKRSCVTCCCSRRPMAQQTKADIVWWPLLQWERSGVCIWHSGFWGGLFEGLVSVSLISEKRQELAYSRCLGATKNEEPGNMLLLQRTYSIADTHQREQEITNSWKKNSNKSL